MSTAIPLLHTATISHHVDAQGCLHVHALCTSCDWSGPVRGTAAEAWDDGLDHEDGVPSRPVLRLVGGTR